MMKSKRTIALKAHLWLYFCTFAVAIMSILWILQILFLGAFFNTMKLSEMKKIGNLIEERYDVNSENFYDFWFEHSFQTGMFAQLVTENGAAVRNFGADPGAFPGERDVQNGRQNHNPKPHFETRGFINSENAAEFIQKVSSGNGSVAYVDRNDGHGASFAVYGSHLGELDGEQIYLFLISPLERTDATRKVLETQLIIASCISILLALVLAYFIARRLSKPIESTTEVAGRLAAGDYNVSFGNGAYREIDELSDVLNHAASELSKTEELRRDLISNVSHDLRTPLTIIKSYAELIRDISGDNEEKRLKHTNVIIEEANNLSLLVNDMLDLSKIQSGTVNMDIKSFDLAALTEATVERFEYFRENHGITFEICNTCEDAHVLGDHKRIEQVIYNLVANAINFTGDDKKVAITLCDSKDYVKLSVIDSGCGMDSSELDMVWDKYYTAREKHRNETAGTGIGLSMVKNILLAHNADFGAESVKGEGSTFWFELNKSSQSFTQSS